ncbi:MAG: DUF1549 domain-containing protein [Planctomycetaceae bacterium]
MFALPQHRSIRFILLLTAIVLPGTARGDDALKPDDVTFFEERIRPVLVEHCYECHSANSKILRGGLLVDSRDPFRKGGDSGPAFVAGSPDESLLIKSLRHETYEMPPKGKLPDPVIADFVEWVRRGAPDPRTTATQGKLKPVDWDAAAKHWAFNPVTQPVPPEIQPADDREASWTSNPIDRFVLTKLRQEGFHPAPQADKRTLIRRATFDLTGLPPTPVEVNEFLADESPDAFAKAVDRLLSSPHYGERWGRHWLDLVRYADSNGADENHGLPNSWRYRDYVIRKFNEDLPLDQFIVQQLAGDLLPVPDDEKAAGDLITATGMLVIGPKMLAEQDKDKMIIDIVDEQVDNVSRTMLGLTMGCARCHDHKFDPLAARDYYALAGIFYSTKTMANREFVSQWLERPLPSKDIERARVAHQAAIDQAKAELERLNKEAAASDMIKTQQAAVEKLEKEMPAFDQVMSVTEGTPTDLPVHLRGNHLTQGPEKIARTMPTILTRTLPAPAIAREKSGRLEFAQWLVSPQHPLTSRVMANRIWMWHFGKPLMKSPSNFGLQSEPPTHPELLDWLAQELMRRKWSLKDMHRLIMLSSTWQMASSGSPDDEERDPENRFWRRANRRRLEAEPVRDSILFVGNQLDTQLFGAPAGTDAKRRAIYISINRAALYQMFSTFDYVETDNHIEQRPVTIVPSQALFMMNSPMVFDSAKSLAGSVLSQSSADPAADQTPLLNAVFEKLFARQAQPAEVERSLQFLRETEQLLNNVPDAAERRLQTWAALCRSLMASNEFVYVD